MFEWVKARVLKLMRVPHEPEPPLGAPGSVRVFRAGLNHYRLRVLRWFFGQGGAIVGIGFSLVALGAFEVSLEQARLRAAEPQATAQPSVADGAPSSSPGPAAPAASPDLAGPSASPAPTRSREERRRAREKVFARVVSRTPWYIVPLVEFFEVVGIVLFLVQALITYAIVRLEFEQHWYIVTDRSLRIRTGILRLQESTMSFANIQQVEILQGPLQRLLGLASVCVRSAGGGDPAAGAKGHGAEPSLHTGIFEGVPNAVEIRDLIIERLRRFREAGLGDPEDRHHALPSPAPSAVSTADAIRELLLEAKALRGALLR